MLAKRKYRSLSPRSARILEKKLSLLPDRITTVMRDSDNPQLMQK